MGAMDQWPDYSVFDFLNVFFCHMSKLFGFFALLAQWVEEQGQLGTLHKWCVCWCVCLGAMEDSVQ